MSRTEPDTPPFQSTPSVGRATTPPNAIMISCAFQSTPSVGRATFQNVIRINFYTFQSTPSVGRATSRQTPRSGPGRISIHALRGEGDPRPKPRRRRLCRISIHALRGEGDCMASPCGAVIDVFQSTPSVGRATGQCIKPHLRQSISIHALRGEGDQ